MLFSICMILYMSLLTISQCVVSILLKKFKLSPYFYQFTEYFSKRLFYHSLYLLSQQISPQFHSNRPIHPQLPTVFFSIYIQFQYWVGLSPNIRFSPKLKSCICDKEYSTESRFLIIVGIEFFNPPIKSVTFKLNEKRDSQKFVKNSRNDRSSLIYSYMLQNKYRRYSIIYFDKQIVSPVSVSGMDASIELPEIHQDDTVFGDYPLKLISSIESY